MTRTRITFSIGQTFLTGALLAAFAHAAIALGQPGEGVAIKPYTGEPVFLPQAEEPPAPQLVREREVVSDKYEDGKVRFERQVAKYSDNSVVNNGYYREFYQSGQAFVEGQYRLGTRVGEWSYFHEDGVLAKKLTYKDGEPDGVVETYRPDGTLRRKREYRVGARTGVWVHYDKTGEKPTREERYKDGVADGVWRQWYPSGQQWRETPFVAGKRDGQAKEWNQDGSLRLTAEFVAGVREGLTVEWNSQGEKTERRFKAGKMVVE